MKESTRENRENRWWQAIYYKSEKSKEAKKKKKNKKGKKYRISPPGWRRKNRVSTRSTRIKERKKKRRHV